MISVQLGNGKKISFWFDKWTHFGQLINYLGNAGPQSLRVPLDSTVSTVSDGGNWLLAAPRSDEVLSLIVYLTTITPPNEADGDDYYEWRTRDGESGSRYTARKTWESLRHRAEAKDWVELIWFKGNIPKHSFNMWVANYNKLPTRSRLVSWGLNVPSECCLCSNAEETRDHLFLNCDFSNDVWRHVLARMHPTFLGFADWDDLILWTTLDNATAPSLLRKLVIQATIFHLWKQRNNVLHNEIAVPPIIVFRGIEREVRNAISARRHRRSFAGFMQCWLR